MVTSLWLGQMMNSCSGTSLYEIKTQKARLGNNTAASVMVSGTPAAGFQMPSVTSARRRQAQMKHETSTH
jgi:hypothetical protein